MPVSRFARFVPAGWLVFLALFGGASRYDEWQQIVVALASAAMLLVALWTPHRTDLRAKRGLWLLLAGVAAAIAVQLIPLPPSLWTRLPGHQPFVASATLTGLDRNWRPLTLTPDLTWAALWSLLPVVATLAVAPRSGSAAVRPLAWALIGIFTTTTLLGLVQTLGAEGAYLFRNSNVGSASGLFANRNHNAVFLTLAFPTVAYLLTTRRRAGRVDTVGITVGACAAALYFVAIVQAGSRSGLILATLMLCATLAAVLTGHLPASPPQADGRMRTTAPAGKRLTAGIGLAAIAALAILVLVIANSNAFDRLVQSGTVQDYRARILPVLLHMARDFAPWGSGYGSFATVFLHYEPFNTLRFTYFNQAHDDIVQMLIEGGIPSGALMIAAASAWGVRTFQILRSSRKGTSGLELVGSLFVVVLFLGSFADYPLRTPLLAAVLVIAGVWMLPSRPLPPWREPRT